MSVLQIPPFWLGVRAGVGALLLIALSGCASTSTTEPIQPCCYSGDVSLAHVGDVQLALVDGSKVGFSQVFPGYEPQSGLFTTAFPFRRVEIARVTYPTLQPVLPQYDANGNGRLEEPELTVLYIREAALGLGLSVDYVVTKSRVDALVLSTSETGGLVRYVDGNLERMTPSAKDVFKKLELVGREIRTRGSENNGRKSGTLFVP